MDEMPPSVETPPLFRDVAEGRVGVGLKVVITLVLAAVSVAAATIGAYVLAATNPAWDRYRNSYGVHPSDELLLGTSVVAGVGFLSAVAWLWSRGRSNRTIIYTSVLSVAVIGATIALAALVEDTLRGDRELVMAGVVCLGAAGLTMLWVYALRRHGRGGGRPPRNPTDGMLDVLCPACGYRMVGLHESRCPECGATYTLDELLARQQFAAVRHVPVPQAGAAVSG